MYIVHADIYIYIVVIKPRQACVSSVGAQIYTLYACLGLLDVTKQSTRTCMECLIAHPVLLVVCGWLIHICCLVAPNKLVAVASQDSIRPYKVMLSCLGTVTSSTCTCIYIHSDQVRHILYTSIDILPHYNWSLWQKEYATCYLLYPCSEVRSIHSDVCTCSFIIHLSHNTQSVPSQAGKGSTYWGPAGNSYIHRYFIALNLLLGLGL